MMVTTLLEQLGQNRVVGHWAIMPVADRVFHRVLADGIERTPPARVAVEVSGIPPATRWGR